VCGKLVLDDGTLAGSDLDMASAVRFGTTHLELALEEALKMASAYPALYLGLEQERGFLRPGARGDVVHLDEALNVRQVWSAP
ncbi:amidohydrolase family protein, partial [Paraburkholderia sp. SIMBA_061]